MMIYRYGSNNLLFNIPKNWDNSYSVHLEEYFYARKRRRIILSF